MAGRAGFWVPGTAAPGIAVDRDAGADQQPVVFNPLAHLSVSLQRQQLPIFQHRDELVYAFEKYRCVVVSGQAGCGKSTQIPQYLHENGWSRLGYRIVCSQPRPLSAVTIATRVAQEMGIEIGGIVGYSVPFEDHRSANTQIEFVTDRILIAEMMKDPLLSAYSVVIIDEAHERTLETDVLLGLLRKISSRRSDLRIVISSATIDTELFRNFFEMNPDGGPENTTAVAVSVENSLYPVQALYASEPIRNYIQDCVELIMNIHIRLPSGDILVFMPSKDEVDQVTFLLRERTETDSKSRPLRALPMYAGLHYNEQIKVLEPSTSSYRKAIISTNISETSITVPSVVYVVDSGFVKQSAFDPQTGFQTFLTVPISQAEAAQRAGRAGRVRPGHVYRMYTVETFRKLQAFPSPAIRRESPDLMVLYLKAIGIRDLIHFEYLEPPSMLSLSSALQLLYSLAAIDDSSALTSIGTSVIELNLPSRLGKALLESVANRCSSEMIDIASMLSVSNVFSRPRNKQFSRQSIKGHKKFAVAEGDLITLLNVWRGYNMSGNGEAWCNDYNVDLRSMRRASQIRKRIKRAFKSLGLPVISCGETVAPIVRCIVAGFFMNVASLQRDGTYSTLTTHNMAKVQLRIHPNSTLVDQSPQWIIYYDAIHTDQIYIRDLTKIEPTILTEVAPNFFEKKL